jgi:hypothetical protein
MAFGCAAPAGDVFAFVTSETLLGAPADAWKRALGMSFHTGFASALGMSAFQPLISRAVVGHVDLRATSSLYAVVWIAYLLDRLPSQPEDAMSVAHSAGAARRFPIVFGGLLAALGCFELVLLIQAPWLVVPVSIAVAVSVFYSAPIPLFRVRAKAIPYFKGFYLSVTSIVTIVAFTPVVLQQAAPRSALLLFVSCTLYFLNYSLFDIKDIEGDRLANIKTLAGALGVRGFLRAQFVLAIVVAVAVSATLGARSVWPISVVALFHAGVCLRLFRRPLTPTLCGVIDLGYGVILAVGALFVKPMV